MKVSTVSEMRALDRTAIEEFGIVEELLMENAGQAVYSCLLKEFGIEGKRFLIFCGLGNNGGNGLFPPAGNLVEPVLSQLEKGGVLVMAPVSASPIAIEHYGVFVCTDGSVFCFAEAEQFLERFVQVGWISVYKILEKQVLGAAIKLMVIQAPEIAAKAKAGQFTIVRIDECGERIPLTIADLDRDAGSVAIVFQEVGKSTMKLGTLEAGGEIIDLVGPLGRPSEVENFGTVVCVGGGVGIALVYPIARALAEAGNNVVGIVGARTRDLLFWDDKMQAVCDELIVCTDDGTYGRMDLVTAPLKEILESRQDIARVWAVGPTIMMKFCAKTTEPFGVRTIVSLNPIMVDGTGMCGACRVEVDGQTRFACVDGPEFDGHRVNWDLLMARQRIYLEQERKAMDHFRRPMSRCLARSRRGEL